MVKVTPVPSRDEILANIKNVRNDKTPESWALLKQSVAKPAEIEFFKSGTGGYQDMASHLTDDAIYYGVMRVEEMVEATCATTKFVGFNFVGSGVSFVAKGRLGIYNGDIMDNYISPIIVSFQGVNDPSELNDDAIKEKVAQASNTASRVLESTVGRVERGFTDKYAASSQIPSRNTATSIASTALPKKGNQLTAPISKRGSISVLENQKSSEMKFDDALRTEIAHVRSDTHPNDWVVACFKGNDCKSELTVQKSGTGGFDALLNELKDDTIVNFAFWRTKDVYDNVETVKFIYIAKVSCNVKPIQKAKLTTLLGGIRSIFEPFHVKIDVDAASDLSVKSIMNEVKKASGSRDWTK